MTKYAERRTLTSTRRTRRGTTRPTSSSRARSARCAPPAAPRPGPASAPPPAGGRRQTSRRTGLDDTILQTQLCSTAAAGGRAGGLALQECEYWRSYWTAAAWLYRDYGNKVTAICMMKSSIKERDNTIRSSVQWKSSESIKLSR